MYDKYAIAKLRREKAFAGKQEPSLKDIPSQFAMGFEDSAHALQQLASHIPIIGDTVASSMPYEPAARLMTLGGRLGPTDNLKQNVQAYRLAALDAGNRPNNERIGNDALDFWSWFVAPSVGKGASVAAEKLGGPIGTRIASLLGKRFAKGAVDVGSYMSGDEILARMLGVK
jgi:hypothetical protein